MPEDNIQVSPTDARTYLTDFVSDPENLKTMQDADVLKLHGKVSARVAKERGGGKGGEGNDGPFWKSFGFDDKADKEAVDFLTAKNPPDPKTAVQSWMNADKVARDRNAIPLPEKDKLLEWPGFEKLGWPKDPTKYEIKPDPKHVEAFKAKGIAIDQAEHDHFVKSAHGLKILPAQAQELYKALSEFRLQRIGELEGKGTASAQQLETALREEWKGPDYDTNSEIARRAMTALGVGVDDASELEKILGKEGKPGAPRLIKLFHKIGSELGEDKLGGGGSPGGDALPNTIEAIDTELNRLGSDREWMKIFNDSRHVRNKEVTAQRQRLIDKKAKLQARAPAA